MKRSLDETADRFDEFSSTYDDFRSDTHVFTALRTLEVALRLSDSDSTVIDIGTGTGALALHLAGHVKKVIGLDISEGMLERAKEKAELLGIENVEFRQGRFRDIDVELNDSVDLIMSSFAMHHLNDSEKLEGFREMKNAIASSGSLVIGDIYIISEEDASLEFYHPEVDDPSELGFLVDELESMGFTVDFHRTGPMTGVLEGSI